MSGAVSQYPLRKRRDLRSAKAVALRDLVKAIRFRFPATRTPTTLAVVFDRWADFERVALASNATLPAAAVLPDKTVESDDSFTPRILEDTWTGGDPSVLGPDGRPLYPMGRNDLDGLALFAVAEKVTPFVVVVRAVSDAQRQAIVSAFEDAFVETGQGPGEPVVDGGVIAVEATTDVRFGRVVAMPDYYGRAVRFTLTSHQLLDTEQTAKENRWIVQFDITAEAKHCVLRRVPRMDARVLTVVDGRGDNR